MATLSVRGRFWILNWQENGQRHRKSLGRVDVLPEKDARAILQAKQLELSTGANLLGLGLRRALTFRQYAAEYLAWHESEYPDSHYRVRQIVEDHLCPAFQFMPLDMIEPRRVEQYKHDRLKVAAVGSVTKELRTLQAILNYAVREGVLQRNPVAFVQAPKDLNSRPHRFYETGELQALYDATIEPWHAHVWKLYANTGMRRMEGLHLRWRDVGKEGIRVLSTGEERTKSGEWRDIPLSKGAQEALEGLGKKGDRVIPQIAPPSLSRAFVKDAVRAGLDGSLHTLRHTYISHLVRQGVPLRTVQIYAGHAHYTTTEKYAYLAPGKAPRQARVLSL